MSQTKSGKSQIFFNPSLSTTDVTGRVYNSLFIRGTFKSKAPLRVQFSLALGGRGWERVKAEASPRLY